jgi:hypothetical protein
MRLPRPQFIVRMMSVEAGSQLERLQREHWLRVRFLGIGCILGTAVAYSVLIVAKLAWDLEESWWGVALTPLFGFGLPFALLTFGSLPDEPDPPDPE